MFELTQICSTNSEKIFIIIPTYNESENIENLVGKILELHSKVQFIIVDDNSPDGTGEISDKISAKIPTVHVLHRSKKLGLGTAYVQGFKKALAEGAEFIFEMDADFSHDPNEIAYFFQAIEKADVVIGSRYLHGVRVIGWRFRRLVVSKLANIFVSHIMIFPRITDYTSGFRCYRREVLESVELDKIQSDGYAFQIEMAHLAYKNGFKIIEIPTIFKGREKGESKISRNVVFEAFWLTLKLHASFSEIIKEFLLSYKKYFFLDK
jgi:dolichol-phosphate mannosyltransferase